MLVLHQRAHLPKLVQNLKPLPFQPHDDPHGMGVDLYKVAIREPTHWVDTGGHLSTQL